MNSNYWIGSTADQLGGPYSGVLAGKNILLEDIVVPPQRGEYLVVDLHGQTESWFTVVAVTRVRESADSYYFQLRLSPLSANPTSADSPASPARVNSALDLGSRIAEKAGFSLTGFAQNIVEVDQPEAADPDTITPDMVSMLRSFEAAIRSRSDQPVAREQALECLAQLLANPLVADIIADVNNGTRR